MWLKQSKYFFVGFKTYGYQQHITTIDSRKERNSIVTVYIKLELQPSS